MHVGHSTGGGEVVRYIGSLRQGRVGRSSLIAAIPPLMLKTHANPAGTPIAAFDAIRAGVEADRSQFSTTSPSPSTAQPTGGESLAGRCATHSGVWACRRASPAAYDCIKAFSETDFTQDLKALDVPILVAAGGRRSDRADRRRRRDLDHARSSTAR